MVWKFGVVVAVALLGVYVSAVPLENDISADENENVFPVKNMAKCAEAGGVTGIINCAAIRALKSLQYYSKQGELEIVPGVSLTSDEHNIERIGKELSENDLPTDPIEKADKLFSLLLENSARVFSGRTLKVKMPENVVESMSRALDEEGRARKRRKGGKFGSMMFGLGAKMFSIVPAVIAGLALLSTKALIIAKLALVLSVVVFFQYFASKGTSLFSGFGGGHGGTGYGSYGGSYNPPTWTTNSIGGGGSSYPYARSIDVADAQSLAYSHQKQN